MFKALISKKNSSKIALALATTMLTILAVTGCSKETAIEADKQQNASPKTFDILFLGDTSHGESYQVKYEAEGKANIIKEKGYDYSLANFKPFLESGDYTIVNVETPLTNIREAPFPDKGYNHWTDATEASAAYVRHGFDAVSLANNHTLDFGVPGLEETIAALDNASIEYFGAGMDKARADAPLRKSFNVGQCEVKMVVFGRFEYRQSYEDKYEFYAEESRPGASALHMDELLADIRAEKARDPNQFVVVYPHWGKNYKWRLDSQEQEATQMIAAGADMIIGHGSHTAGEIMEIDGVPVVYSLGNFVFNTWGRFPLYPDVLPMSLASRLVVEETSNGASAHLKLYPIYSNNRVVNYQPRFVTDEEFDLALRTLEEKTEGTVQLTNAKDQFGSYLQTPHKDISCQ